MHNENYQREEKIKRHNTGVVTILSGLLIILFSVGTSINLGSLFGEKINWLISTETIQIMTFILLAVSVLFGWAEVKILKSTDIFYLFLPFILMAISLISQAIGVRISGYMTVVQTVIHVFIMYFLVCFLKQTKFSFHKGFVANFIVLIGVFESVLGIIQHIASDPFFDTQKLNAIYFLDGKSSSTITNLGSGASVRAFGTFDSGLTLGIFLMLSLAILIDLSNIKKIFKIIFSAIYLVAIYYTLTRNVYIGLVSFLFIYFLLRLNIKSIYFNWFYFITTIIGASLFWLTGLLDWLVSLAKSANVMTFGIRFIYLKQVIAGIPDALHFFLGSNITTAEGIPIDSSAISIIAEFGLIFAFFVFLLQNSIFNSTLSVSSVKMPALGAFLFLFPIMGASNDVIQSFLIAAALVSLFINGDIKRKE